MSSWLFLKVLADTSLYFSLIGIVPFACGFEFYLPALIYAASAMLAHMLTKLHPSLRFSCYILPLSTLLLARTMTENVILLLPIIYAMAVITRAKYSPEYYRFLSYFKKVITMWCIFLGASLLFSEMMAAIDDPVTLNFSLYLTYGIASFFSSVLLLRSVRLGSRISHATDRKQLLVTVGSIAGFSLIAISTERVLMKYGLSLVQLIISFFKTILASPIYLVLLIMDLLSGDGEREAIEVSSTYVPVSELPTEEVEYFGGETSVAAQAAAEESFPWWIVIAAFVALAVLLFMMFRLQQTHEKSHKMKDIFLPVAKKKKSQNATVSNRNKVRRYYRDFLKHEKLRGVKLKSNQTSSDILENVRPNKQKPASDLREVYLHARYDEGSTITSEQVEQTRLALKKIREK